MALLATPPGTSNMGMSTERSSAPARARTIAPSTVTLLHDAVAKYELSAASSRTGDASPSRDKALCDMLERLCREAHEAGLGPERVVVMLKEAYRSVPVKMVEGQVQRTRYRHVFMKCVKMYFRLGNQDS